MKYSLVTLCIVLFSLIGCKKNDPYTTLTQNDLSGFWVANENYIDNEKVNLAFCEINNTLRIDPSGYTEICLVRSLNTPCQSDTSIILMHIFDNVFDIDDLNNADNFSVTKAELVSKEKIMLEFKDNGQNQTLYKNEYNRLSN